VGVDHRRTTWIVAKSQNQEFRWSGAGSLGDEVDD